MEENECRRAHALAVEKYNQVFKKDDILDEVRLQYLNQKRWRLSYILTIFVGIIKLRGSRDLEFEKNGFVVSSEDCKC